MTLGYVPPQLPAVVRMLASPHDGEVLAAVAALRRLLTSKGADINDLADLLARGVPYADRPRDDFGDRQREQQEQRRSSGYDGGVFDWSDEPVRGELRAMLELARSGSLIFTAWEREFIVDVAERAGLSDRQAQFLMKAHAKYLRANQSF